MKPVWTAAILVAREECMKKIKYCSGQKFNDWTLIEYSSKDKKWKASCCCGKEKMVYIDHLTSGASKSCGCSRGTHNMTGTPEYQTWSSMKDRCLNENNDRYSSYGGRGIKICERWLSFENFFSDLGERPKGTSIGRIDNDGDYCKENCRWESNKQQMRNRRNTVRILGEDISSLSERLDMNYGTLAARIKRGWDEKEAVETPVFRNEDSIRHTARQMNLNPDTVCCRISRGWSVEKALSTPIKKRRELKSISEKSGISSEVISNRLLRGWSMDRATTQPIRSSHCS